MKHLLNGLLRIALFILMLLFWKWMISLPLSTIADICIIVTGILLIFPAVWSGRKILDRDPTLNHMVRTTTAVHYVLVFLFGTSIFRAVTTHQDWAGWILPIPVEISWPFVIVTGAVLLFTVVNLALKGLGAPFAIALSRKLAVDWMYAWTRNPMVLATLVFLLVLGIWFQSALFVLWVLILVTPAWVVYLKVFEERELEIRFGESYREYKSRTPMLIPRRPRG